jgi:predicted nucleic acid-binding Zn ribbon protein
MRRTNTQSISEVLTEVLKEYKLDERLRETRVYAAWPEVLGPLAKTTESLYMKNGVLFVCITSSVVRNELLMRRSDIVKALNEKTGENTVRDIVFR